MAGKLGAFGLEAEYAGAVGRLSGMALEAEYAGGLGRVAGVALEVEYRESFARLSGLAVETEYVGQAARLAGLRLEVEYREPPPVVAERIEVLVADGLALASRLRQVVARGRVVVAAGTTSARDLGLLEAEVGAEVGKLMAYRARLDAWDAPQAPPPGSGAARLLALWTWERSVRRALVQLAGQARRLQVVARRAAHGQPDRAYLVRAGDTWQSIARTQLGDWRRWAEIVDHNAADAEAPVPGALLSIPR